MTSALKRLFDEILAEAERKPDFGRRLMAALAETPPVASGSGVSKRKSTNRRARGVLDPFEVYMRGESQLRQALSGLTIDQLKDIVSERAMDSSKLALKWRSPERLMDLIVTTVRARVEKGDAFKRSFVAHEGEPAPHRLRT
jgi:hypothetical protein